MHIYFSGIGGTGIGPLALIAHQAGYEVSGSDKQASQYIDYLKKRGINDIHIGQKTEQIAKVHEAKPIDWLVYSSALPLENPNHPELAFAKDKNIKASKRDALLNKIIKDHNIKLVAVAGTHGKTTTTAMIIWLFKQLGIPISYSVGAKIDFGDMGQADLNSKYFVLEADEFDRSFLAFNPELAIITGLGYDHHEIYRSSEEYNDAFKQFIYQSQRVILWQTDLEKLNKSSIIPSGGVQLIIEDEENAGIENVKLAGLYNRRDGWLAARALHELAQQPLEKLLSLISSFPGVGRRFEKITENLYSDYAHTPEKIKGAMSVAQETLKPDQKLIVIYEPLTNRRMHHLAKEHQAVFSGADKLYWVPSYLAREDPEQAIFSPEELIKNLNEDGRKIASPARLNVDLKTKVQQHLESGDLVLALCGGGGGSLDEWLRREFRPNG